MMDTDGPESQYRLNWPFFNGLVVFLLLTASSATPAAGQRYTFANYGPASGLANVNTTALLESRSGTIWVSTQKGIFKANGARFEEQQAFPAVGMESAWAMSEDNEGRIWTVDGSHLAYWENGSVHRAEGVKLHLLRVSGVDLIKVPAYPDAIYLHHDSQLQRVSTVDDGKSWQLSDAFAPELRQRYPELNQLVSVIAGNGSMVWAGCGKSICSIDLAQGTVKEFGLREGVAADSWTSLLLTRSGNVWARGQHSVEILRAEEDRFSPVTGLPKGRSSSSSSPLLVEDRDGKILMNLSEGFLIMDGRKRQFLNHTHGLPQDEIGLMLSDHTGGLWLAPAGRGISRWLGYGTWEGWSKADGLSSTDVLEVAQDKMGRKWIATQLGLDMLGPGSSSIKKFSKLPLDQLTAVAVRGTHVWTGDSFGRVVDSEPEMGRSRIALKNLDTVYQIVTDKENRVWVCSPKGLDYFAPFDKWSQPHHVEQQLIPKGNAYGISEGVPGVLWVMTEKGMYRLDGAEWSTVRIPVKAGPSYNLMAAAAADGTLWVQSRHPTTIVHLRITGQTASVLSEFSDPIMQSENLGFMGLDKRGWLWIESDRGLHVFNGKQWVRCNSEDGLLYDNPDYPAFLADSDGSIWIGTSAGLSHLLHPEELFRIPRPALELTNLQLDGSALREGVEQEFDLRRPALSVGLVSTNYNRSGAIVYRYHLEGLESVWQETTDSSLRFPSLDPGKYTLRVVALDRRLHQSSHEQTVAFTVLEPWWNRTWFRFIEMLLGAATLLGLSRLSVHILVMRQRELEAMVVARTSELERDKADLVSVRSALLETTRRDNLTGLLNRAAIFERMHELCEDSLATGSTLAIVMADIDHFKNINDIYGHVVGDVAIRECSDRISRTVRPVDFVGRYGGEEILILMPGLDPASSHDRLEELRATVAAKPIRRGSVEVQITCSFGLAWMGNQRCALETLIDIADGALYLAKKRGRNRVEFAGEICALDAPSM